MHETSQRFVKKREAQGVGRLPENNLSEGGTGTGVPGSMGGVDSAMEGSQSTGTPGVRVSANS